MRRTLFAVLACAAVALIAPGAAAAAPHGHARHHAHRSRGRSHRSARPRVLHFGTLTPTTGAGAGTTGVSGASASGPTSRSQGDTAGTVASFTAGVLTITLTDGSTVSGKVTEETELGCRPAAPAGSSDDGGDEGTGSGDQGREGSSESDRARSASAGGDEQEGGGDHGDDQGSGDDGESQSCTTAALTPGAVVAEAELSIGGSGAVWDHIELIG
jgi:hypothetical protein